MKKLLIPFLSFLALPTTMAVNIEPKVFEIGKETVFEDYLISTGRREEIKERC